MVVEFVVGAIEGNGSGVVYLAIARDTGGLKRKAINDFIYLFFFFSSAK